MKYFLALAILVVGGCTVGPNYHAPATDMPVAFGQAGAAATTMPATQRVIALARWWGAFEDPTLNTLIEQAIKSNQDLRIAESRVREARALRHIAAADRWPNVDVSGSYNRTRRSENISGFGGGSGGTPPGGGAGGGSTFNFGPRDDDFYQAGFDATWELDVFGGVRRSVEAATADVAALEENRRDVLVTLLAEVARNYIELRGLQRQRAVALANVDSQRQTLELSSSRFKAGVANELDVKRAEALVSTTQSTIPAMEAAIQRAIHRLNVLEGRQPETKLLELFDDAKIPAAVGQVPIGLPSELLRRRPDIRRAERELAAATARIGVATSELFPKFSLTGSIGQQSSDIGDLAKSSSTFWSLGPSIRWPIFDGGRIRGNIRVQNARQEQALARYEQSVLIALEDVENTLVNYGKEQERFRSLDTAVKANRRAVEMATELYNRGVIDFLSVLEAQRSLFASEDQLISSERLLSADLVALYKALGGGWEPTQ